MERLTKRFTDGTFYAEDIEDVGIEGINHPTYVGKVVDKLADYEDKEEQGLLISLPLKVGDVVYSYFRLWRKEDGIVPYQITNFTITQNKKGVWTKKYRAMWLVDGKTCDKPLNFSFDEIGKNVFLTRSEAEEALAKMGGKA